MKADINVNKKDFLRCNFFYMKKFFGKKEVILLTLLLASGIALFYMYSNIIMLIMFGVTLLLGIIAGLVYIGTAIAGYKIEFEKRNVVLQSVNFEDKHIIVDAFNKNMEQDSSEKFDYDRFDKIAIRRDVIYIYPATAVALYIKPSDIKNGTTFAELCAFLESNVDASKFKMKSKIKQFR